MLSRFLCYTDLRFVKWHFLSSVFKFFVPVCFFCSFCLLNMVVYQLFTTNQQFFKKKTMMVVDIWTFMLVATFQNCKRKHHITIKVRQKNSIFANSKAKWSS